MWLYNRGLLMDVSQPPDSPEARPSPPPRHADPSRKAHVGGAPRGAVLRRSLFLATLAWGFGSVWMNSTAGTPLANFATALRASEFEKGLLAAMPFLASLLCIPAALLIERTGERKRIFFWGLLTQRFMWIPIAVLPVWLIQRYGVESAAAPAMALFLMLMFLMHAGQAVGGPAWISWMADVVPDRVRGKYFGRRRQWGILPALPAAVAVGYLLDRYGGTPQTTPLRMLYWCSGIFLVAMVFGVMDIAMFKGVADVPKPPRRGAHLLRAWLLPLRNRNFLWFAGFVATLVFAVSFMGQFVTFYIIEQLGGAPGGTGARGGVNMVTQLMLIVAPALAQLLVFSTWGRAADRMGKRPLMILAGLGLVPVGLGWCLVTRQTIWLGYVLSAAGAALWAGVEIANFNLVLEFAGSDELSDGAEETGGSGYVAVNSVIVNVAGCLGGLSAGIIAQHLRDIDFAWVTRFKTFTFYDVLFLISGLMRLVAVVIFVPHVHEPASKPTREALRFVTANIYNNLFTAVLAPVRMMGWGVTKGRAKITR